MITLSIISIFSFGCSVGVLIGHFITKGEKPNKPDLTAFDSKKRYDMSKEENTLKIIEQLQKLLVDLQLEYYGKIEDIKITVLANANTAELPSDGSGWTNQVLTGAKQFNITIDIPRKR